jgi:hypothetical protein
MATPVTGTVVVVALAANVAVAATVATAVLLELTLTVRPPAGAGCDKVSVRFCVAVPVIDRFNGEKLSVPGGMNVTVAVVFRKLVRPPAVMVVFPAAMIVTGIVMLVWPARNTAVAGTVATLVLLELRFTVNPAPTT